MIKLDSKTKAIALGLMMVLVPFVWICAANSGLYFTLKVVGTIGTVVVGWSLLMWGLIR